MLLNFFQKGVLNVFDLKTQISQGFGATSGYDGYESVDVPKKAKKGQEGLTDRCRFFTLKAEKGQGRQGGQGGQGRKSWFFALLIVSTHLSHNDRSLDNLWGNPCTQY